MSDTTAELDLDAYSLEELNRLMDNAKKQIQQKRDAEIQRIRDEMQKLANQVNMRPEDILNINAEGRKRKINRALGKIKYRNPDNQEQTWTGRGKRPNWLVQATNQGIPLERFRVPE